MADGTRPKSDGRSERFVRLQTLIRATRRGNLNEVRQLVKAGVGVNCTAGGVTALHVAAAHDHVECAEFLLENQAKVNQTIADLVTPLHVAVRFESLACVVLFTSRGADVNAVNKEGWTPLHMAARNGNVRSAEILLYNGAQLEAPLKPRNFSADELSPLHFAARHGHANCIEILLKHGADINRQSAKTLTTALHLATRHKHLGCVCVLLCYRASSSVPDIIGNQPLHIACRNGDLESVELLLQAGASTDYYNNKGNRPIDVASAQVSTLLKVLSGKPRNLFFLCVQTIRASLYSHRDPKKLNELVSDLPLPLSIKGKVGMDEVVEMVKDSI